MERIFLDYVLPCLWAFLACVGFTLVFNIHGVGKLICGFGGGLGWLVYLLGGQQHRGRVPGCGGHRRLFGDHGPAAPLPGDRLSAGSTSPLVPGEVSITPRATAWPRIQTGSWLSCCTPLGWRRPAVGAMLASSVFRTVFPRLYHRPAGS